MGPKTTVPGYCLSVQGYLGSSYV